MKVGGRRLEIPERPPTPKQAGECVLHYLFGIADITHETDREPNESLAVPVIEDGDQLVTARPRSARITFHSYSESSMPRKVAADPPTACTYLRHPARR